MKAVITLTGPSLSGKSSLARELALKTNAEETVSTTTREPRPDEISKYKYVTKEEIKKLDKDGQLVELGEYQDNFYALEEKELERIWNKGNIAIHVCEPSGMYQLRGYCQEKGIKIVKIFTYADIDSLIDRFYENRDYSNATKLKSLVHESKDWFNMAMKDIAIDTSNVEIQDSVAALIEKLKGRISLKEIS